MKKQRFKNYIKGNFMKRNKVSASASTFPGRMIVFGVMARRSLLFLKIQEVAHAKD